MFTFIVFIIVLGLLVFVHEFGHFYAARKNGVKVHEFGFGFPPRICGFRKENGKYKFFWGNKDVESEDTIYSVNLIPLGGFVKIKGEQGEDAGDPDSFASKKAWPRFQILFAGVLMNFILGFIFLAIGFMSGLPIAIDESMDLTNVRDIRVQVMQVMPETPAAAVGLEMADTIRTIDGTEINSVQQLQDIIGANDGSEMVLGIERGNENIEKEITPFKQGDQPARIGVSLVRTGIKDYPWYVAIWQGFVATGIMIWNIIVGFIVIIKNLIITQQAGVDLAGPVGIAVLTGRVAQQGIVYLMQFVAVLSINLGVINLFPFPALDGGRILFLIIEKIRNKPVSQKVENAMHGIGFLLLLLIMLLVTFKDVARFW